MNYELQKFMSLSLLHKQVIVCTASPVAVDVLGMNFWFKITQFHGLLLLHCISPLHLKNNT